MERQDNTNSMTAEPSNPHSADSNDPTSAPAGALEIFPEAFAIGGCVQAREASWIPSTFGGYFPIQAYLLRDTSTFVLIDTGVGTHRNAIRAILMRLIGSRRDGRILMTRNEPDSIINMPWLVSEFDIAQVLFGGELDPLDYFDMMEEASTYAFMRATMRATFRMVPAGSTVNIGERSLEFIRPSLKILTTNWIYERSSKTLFSSDMWAFVCADRCSGPFSPKLHLGDDWLSVDRVQSHLMTKFEWLVGIDTSPLKEDLVAIFAKREIERLCPSYGGIIEGKENVERLLASTLEALTRLQALSRKSVLETFRLNDAL